MDDTALLIERLLATALLPLWLLAGGADALCHRVQRIEATAGVRESLLHWLMLFELGTGILAVLLLEVNAGVLALALVACIAHELTTWCDLAYAASRRRIPPYEQWVHGLQEVLPWAAWVSLAMAHHAQAASLWPSAWPAADWALRWKAEPLPLGFIAAVVAAAGLLVVLPLGAELWRCLRAARPHGGAPGRA